MNQKENTQLGHSSDVPTIAHRQDGKVPPEGSSIPTTLGFFEQAGIPTAQSDDPIYQEGWLLFLGPDSNQDPCVQEAAAQSPSEARQ